MTFEPTWEGIGKLHVRFPSLSPKAPQELEAVADADGVGFKLKDAGNNLLVTGRIRLLADDHTVQRTRFCNGMIVTANFGDSVLRLADGGEIQPLTHRVQQGSGGSL